MLSTRTLVLLATALSAIVPFSPVAAAPAHALGSRQTSGSSTYWLENIERKGTVWGNTATDYKIYRNVLDYGAVGDGVTDDTAAIQKAVSDGNRCGFGCNSSTTLPAIIYFPGRGKQYLIRTPIQLSYMTQMIGDATSKPVIKASSDFSGMGVFDADPYDPYGTSMFINQNNFFRQIRSFVFDFTGSADTATGIHWQVAQATSLQDLDFKMKPGSQQQGIFMDNGSGGFMSDITFSGGKYGAFLGSQQFTSRNLQFTDCETAIFMNWNWGWTFSNITINGGTTGINMANSPNNQTVGSLLLSDSSISGVQYGVQSGFGGNGTGSNTPATGGTLVLDNVKFSNVAQAAVYQNATNAKMLEMTSESMTVTSWSTGNRYDHSTKGTTSNGAAVTNGVRKDASLLDSNKNIFGRSKPFYEGVAVSDFLSAKSSGCKGDGQTDDTPAIQSFLDTAAKQNKIAYFDHGAYIITKTIIVPDTIRITGEIWPLMVATGQFFSDATAPKPVFQIGKPGDKGAVEISDLIFQTKGPAPGAVMIEWNLNSAQGASAMWDSHVRIGGSYGTDLSEANCPGTPTTEVSKNCLGVFLMFHATKQSGNIYLENDWFWVADHDLEVNNQTQISIYSGRGALFESQGPVWLWGTASEHSIIYNYQLDGVQAFFGGFMQSETPYFQPSPMVPTPWQFNSAYDDPTFTICPASGFTADNVPCKDAWGLRVVNSKNVLIYGTGMYSFFNNYGQVCVGKQNCQEYMIRIQNSSVDMYAVTTKAAVNMIADDRFPGQTVLGSDNRDVYGDTVAYYSTG